eukprot:s2_g67.t1
MALPANSEDPPMDQQVMIAQATGPGVLEGEVQGPDYGRSQPMLNGVERPDPSPASLESLQWGSPSQVVPEAAVPPDTTSTLELPIQRPSSSTAEFRGLGQESAAATASQPGQDWPPALRWMSRLNDFFQRAATGSVEMIAAHTSQQDYHMAGNPKTHPCLGRKRSELWKSGQSRLRSYMDLLGYLKLQLKVQIGPRLPQYHGNLFKKRHRHKGSLLDFLVCVRNLRMMTMLAIKNYLMEIGLWGTKDYLMEIRLWGTKNYLMEIGLWGTKNYLMEIGLWGTKDYLMEIGLWGTKNYLMEIGLWGTKDYLMEIGLWGTRNYTMEIGLWGTKIYPWKRDFNLC